MMMHRCAKVIEQCSMLSDTSLSHLAIEAFMDSCSIAVNMIEAGFTHAVLGDE